MAAPVAKRRYTVAEYLELEAAADTRHEYHDGDILAMAGGTYEHGLVALNTGGEVRSRLRGSPCRALGSDMRVRTAVDSRYVYPDVTVICGEPQFDPADKKRTAIINPKVVVEVLSPPTAAYDRGEKFEQYRLIPSLEEYVLVSQDRAAVETFVRRDDGMWLFSAWQGLEAVARLRSLEIDLPLAEVYAGVTFPPPAPPPIDGDEPAAGE